MELKSMIPEILNHYPQASTRRVILGRRGAVATSQPLATAAGLQMLIAGGNAVDAALAMAIALTVVEPTSNGIGSDAFALVWEGQLQGLNASGRSPQALKPEIFAGQTQVEPLGWPAVTIPGAVSAWRALWQRWGKLPFEQLFEPGIRLAEEGFPVSPLIAALWREAEDTFLPLEDPLYQAFKSTFFPYHRAPRAGEIWASPDHGKTLRSIARTGGESFYSGEIAEQIAAFAAETGGLITLEDLKSHQADWVEPISTDYRGYTISEIPPNGQGIGALMALNILEGFEFAPSQFHSAERYHRQIEAMKLAFADIYRHVADPDNMQVSCAEMLDKSYGQNRRALISERAIPLAKPGLPKGGTIYLAASDGDLMISFIQSNFVGFGSGIVIPGTGIALQDRGHGFTLEEGHPNQVGPHKRPFHTIIPGFLSQEGQPLGPFGVMGGSMQPQGHLQVVMNLIDAGLNPQAALDAPRWRFLKDNQVMIEAAVPEPIRSELEERGHDLLVVEPGHVNEYGFGRGQVILAQDQTLVAGSEPRSDGLAMAL